MIPFGILGVAIMLCYYPLLFSLFEKIPEMALHIISAVLLIGFLIDNIISSNVIESINVEGNKLIKDNTEEITDKVKQILTQKSWLHRRLINAFPELKDIRIKIKDAKEDVKKAVKDKEEKIKNKSNNT